MTCHLDLNITFHVNGVKVSKLSVIYYTTMNVEKLIKKDPPWYKSSIILMLSNKITAVMKNIIICTSFPVWFHYILYNILLYSL